MTNRLLLVTAFLIGVPAWAQSPAPRVPLNLPPSVSGDLMPTQVIPEGQRTREWRAEIGLGTACDDNALSSPVDPVSDCTYLVQPSVGFGEASNRLSWNLLYRPTVSIHHRLDNLNEVAQSAGFDVRYRFTRRLTLRARDTFRRTNGLGGGFTTTGDLPQLGLMQGLNSALITPVSTQTSNEAGLDATYQTNASSFLGVSGTFSVLRYSAINGGSTGLGNTQVATAGALYSHLVGRNQWVGFNYNLRDQLLMVGAERSVTHSLLYTHTIVVSPQLTISGFAGPEFTNNNQRLVTGLGSQSPSTSWSAAAGGSVGWLTKFNVLSIGFVRHVGDGGGLVGAARVNSVNATFSRRFSRNWSGDLGASFGNTAELYSVSSFRMATVLAGLTYHIREGFTVHVEYGRDWQRNNNVSSFGDGTINRNRAAISLQYTFGRPFGK